MTFIEKANEGQFQNMDGTPTKTDCGKSLRPVRNRRYTRRSLIAGHRPQKRLFTPEIKRYLKDWLVRRRDNPYPNREEKKHLANDTGLTYIQICNWFANWRRKLKNVNADKNHKTWGHLIRTYNDRAQGNVEQFSICSEDSIWSEPELTSTERESLTDHYSGFEQSPEPVDDYQYEDSVTSESSKGKCELIDKNSNFTDRNKSYQSGSQVSSPLLLSKWLESAARFQPSETNYSWWGDERRRRPELKVQKSNLNKVARHDKDEVEAAVALTALANATNRLLSP